MLEAPAVSTQLRAYHRGQDPSLSVGLVASGVAVVLILVGATIVPLRLSARRIENMEISSGGVE
jgi:hypothetical protein